MRTTVLSIIILVLTITNCDFSGKKNVNFSGEWFLNKEKSKLNVSSNGSMPTRLEVEQTGNDVNIDRFFQIERKENIAINEKITLDGKECLSEYLNSPRRSKANWSKKGKTLTIETRILFQRQGETFETITKEVWTLKERGTVLSIDYSFNSPHGEQQATLVYGKTQPKESQSNKVRQRILHPKFLG